jgi:hypothetical protein
MTEHDRISRTELLRRAAAAAGAVYAAPTITSAAAAAPRRDCFYVRCKLDSEGDAKCRHLGCLCCGGQGRCRPLDAPPCGRREDETTNKCGQDSRCGPQKPCDVAHFCNDAQTCICYVVAKTSGRTECVNFWSGFCADFPPCDRVTGQGCPPGHCCLDTCCPTGICEVPCSSARAAPRIGPTQGTGPRTTL